MTTHPTFREGAQVSICLTKRNGQSPAVFHMHADTFRGRDCPPRVTGLQALHQRTCYEPMRSQNQGSIFISSWFRGHNTLTYLHFVVCDGVPHVFFSSIRAADGQGKRESEDGGREERERVHSHGDVWNPTKSTTLQNDCQTTSVALIGAF